MRQSLIFEKGFRLVFPLLNFLSLVIMLRGHQLPGGGFIGGLVLSCSYGLFLLAFGEKKMRAALLLAPQNWIALGLFTAFGSGVLGILSGREFFSGIWLETEIPGFGHLGTPVTFDLGVFWVVFGVCTLTFLSLKKEEQKS